MEIEVKCKKCGYLGGHNVEIYNGLCQECGAKIK